MSIDFWRGIALLTIFINHIPGNVFERLTHKNFGFSDASEVFVLLAGVAAAFAYWRRFEGGARAQQTTKVVLRAFQIYMAHIVLVVAAAGVVSFAVLQTEDTRFLEWIRFDVLVADPVRGLVGLATLGLQPSYLNILPLYIVLVAAVPLFFLLALRGLGWAVGASLGLYVASQLLALSFPTFPLPDGWFFNPFAWQLIFVIGLVIGIRLQAGASFRRHPLLIAAAAAYALGALLWVRAGLGPLYDLSPLPRFIWEFDKTNLSLPRLLHVLSLVYLVSALPFERLVRASSLTAPLVTLGRHSLPVFCVGTVLSLVGQMLRGTLGGSIMLDTMLIASGIVIQICLAMGLEWYRASTQVQQRGAPAVPAR